MKISINKSVIFLLKSTPIIYSLTDKEHSKKRLIYVKKQSRFDMQMNRKLEGSLQNY
jgi:hypothetical protein